MDSKNFAIGVLSVTAVILFVGVILVNLQPGPAWASGMETSGGDYIMIVGKVQSTPAQYPEEMVYVIDKAENKLIAYFYDIQRKSIVPADSVDLERLADQASGVPQPPPSNRRPPVRRP